MSYNGIVALLFVLGINPFFPKKLSGRCRNLEGKEKSSFAEQLKQIVVPCCYCLLQKQKMRGATPPFQVLH